jgi:hypothetical protein
MKRPHITKIYIINYIKDYYREHNKSPIQTDNTHPFKLYDVRKYFKTWNCALIESGVPLNRSKLVKTKCKKCNIEFDKQFNNHISTYNDFCSHSCSASFNNTGRKMSESTKEKIRQKLIKIKYTYCVICHIEFSFRKRLTLTCGSKCLSELKTKNNLKKKYVIV